MKKILISLTIAGLFLAISFPQSVTAQKIVKTDKQYIVLKMPTDPLVTNINPWGTPTVIINLHKSQPKPLPVTKPDPIPVQNKSKKKARVLNM